MSFTVDSEGTFGELLRGVHQESVVNHILIYVTFHIFGSLLFRVGIDKSIDNINGWGVMYCSFDHFFSHGTGLSSQTGNSTLLILAISIALCRLATLGYFFNVF